MNPTHTIQITDLTEAQRTTLTDWRDELLKLVTQRRECFRATNRQLSTHLSSAVHGAYSAIAEACAPARSEFVATALAAVQSYFERPNDARVAAVKFPALAEFAGFLRCPDTDLTLSGLARLAETTAALIEKMLAGEIVWRFPAAAPSATRCYIRKSKMQPLAPPHCG